MSDNENGLSVSISSASSRRTSSESLEESIRKILNTSSRGVTGFLERYAVMTEGFRSIKFFRVKDILSYHTADPSNCGRVSGHWLCWFT